ncbi:MAG: hypothetical protein J1F31_05550 [Erysipelotrichales bacterium]|nr:hypothetical protein [Erysipelotrichales bacterium]
MKLLSATILLIVLFAFSSSETYAQVSPKPLWVDKGVESLNEKRFSKDYHFLSFIHKSEDEKVVVTSPLALLRQNMAQEFNVSQDVITIDSIMPSGKGLVTYSISFPSQTSESLTTVYVQEVDSYYRYENNIDGTFDYDICNLYAVSDPDVTPKFDCFEVTRKYGALPVGMSLIPGLGQIYKGQSAKGYSILGGEVAFAATITFGEIYRKYYINQGKKDPVNFDSWKSKSNTFRAMRNVGIILGGATYIYNLLDAAFAKGAPHVLIKPAQGNPIDMSFTPIAYPGGFGAGFSFTF